MTTNNIDFNSDAYQRLRDITTSKYEGRDEAIFMLNAQVNSLISRIHNKKSIPDGVNTLQNLKDEIAQAIRLNKNNPCLVQLAKVVDRLIKELAPSKPLEPYTNQQPTRTRPELPKEVWSHIFSFLYLKDLGKLSSVSKAIRFAANNETLWQALYEKRWPGEPKKNSTQSWKQFYRAALLDLFREGQMFVKTPTGACLTVNINNKLATIYNLKEAISYQHPKQNLAINQMRLIVKGIERKDNQKLSELDHEGRAHLVIKQ